MISRPEISAPGMKGNGRLAPTGIALILMFSGTILAEWRSLFRNTSISSDYLGFLK